MIERETRGLPVSIYLAIKAIEDNFIPPTVGYKVPDEECDLDYTPNVGRNADVQVALSSSLGFGGHNASILVKKFEQ